MNAKSGTVVAPSNTQAYLPLLVFRIYVIARLQRVDKVMFNNEQVDSIDTMAPIEEEEDEKLEEPHAFNPRGSNSQILKQITTRQSNRLALQRTLNKLRSVRVLGSMKRLPFAKRM